MDIITVLEVREYNGIRADKRDFTKQEGHLLHVIKSMPKKTKRLDIAYFICADKLVGYTQILGIIPITDGINDEHMGGLWQDVGKALFLWKKNNWYKEPYNCAIINHRHGWKYFDLKKWLKGRKEPDIIKTNKGRRR